MPSTSAASPAVARYQTMTVASMPCMRERHGRPGFSRRQAALARTMTPPQTQEPTTSSVAPM